MIKAYYVMRKDLNMSEAKLGIQIGHGTDMIHMRTTCKRTYQKWIQDFQRRKIVTQIKTEQRLLNLATMLKEKNIEYFEIWDNGLTEFEGKTLTGIVITPADEKYLPKKVKSLQLWKDRKVD